MPRLTIDNHELKVSAGTTVLQAARTLGLDIPSLCFNEHCSALHLLHALPRQADQHRRFGSILRHGRYRRHGSAE